MHNVLIGTVESYENHDAIINFIDTVFRVDKALNGILGDSEKHRLIVVKPNWLQESHEHNKDVWEPVITNPELVICILEYLAGSIRTGTTIFLATLRNRNLCLSGKSFPSATEGIILYLRTMKSPDHPKLARRAEK